MPERAEVFELVQIGVETTPGTAVAATTKLSSIGIEAAPELTSSRYRPRGRKLDTLVIPGRRSSAGSVDGRATYTEIVYPLSSLLGPATITTPDGATNARQWVFEMASGAPDNGTTFTVELGSSVRAGRFAHGQFTGLNMNFTTEEITVGGALIGQKWEDGFTMTPALPEIDLIPIDPNDLSIYVDSTEATLGTTLMESLFAGSWDIGDKVGPVWVINALNPSFKTTVEMAPEATLGLTFAADATGMSFLDVFEAGATRYVQFTATSEQEVEVGFPYSYTAEFAAKVESVSFEDQDGVVGAAWALRMVDDPDLPGLRVTVVNDLLSL